MKIPPINALTLAPKGPRPLPDGPMLRILELAHLPPADLAQLGRVDRRMRAMHTANVLWRTFITPNPNARGTSLYQQFARMPVAEQRAMHALWSLGADRNGRRCRAVVPMLRHPHSWQIAHASLTLFGAGLRVVKEAFQGDRALVLAGVKQNGLALQYAATALQGDLPTVTAALQQDGRAYQHASPEMQARRELALLAVAHPEVRLADLPEAHRDDFDIVAAGIAVDGNRYFDASPRLQAHRAIVLLAAQQGAPVLHTMPAAFLDDAEIMLALTQHDGRAFGAASPRLRADRAVVEQALAYHAPYACIDEALQHDRDLAVHAIKHNAFAFAHLPAVFQQDRAIALQAIHAAPHLIDAMDGGLQHDMDIVRTAIANGYGGALKYATDAAKDDLALVMQAVQGSGTALQYASERLRGDVQVVRKAIDHDARSLFFFTHSLEHHKDLVLRALEQANDSTIYDRLSSTLQEDPEVLLAALHPHGSNAALRVFTESAAAIREDVNLALAALSQSILAFNAVGSLKDDIAFILMALELGLNVYPHLSPAYQSNKDILLRAIPCDAYSYHLAPPELQHDADVVHAFVDHCHFALVSLPADIARTKELALRAVRADGTALAWVPAPLNSDFDVLDAALEETDEAQNHVPEF